MSSKQTPGSESCQPDRPVVAHPERAGGHRPRLANAHRTAAPLPRCRHPADETRTAEARRQISEYLAEQRQVFDLAMTFSLSAFQQQALRLTAAIPYGQTVTYQK
jgi:O6-methylguanine-DNA--protein-cysteine methyltransferase